MRSIQPSRRPVGFGQGKLHSISTLELSDKRQLDGAVVIFDTETNGVARKLNGHIRQVQSLCWSQNDRYLLSASLDWKAILWDLQTGERIRMVRFEAPIFIAELHPTNHFLFAVALFEEQPMLVDITDADPIKTTLPSAPKRSQEEREAADEKQVAKDAKQTTTVIKFSFSGDRIFAGTNKGWINVIDTETCQILASTQITRSIVISIRLTSHKRSMVVNSSDRVIRTFTIPDIDAADYNFDDFHLEEEHKFQDQVTRSSWNHVCWSNHGEYVTASTFMDHSIYVWERVEASLVTILQNPDEVSVVEWHPHKPCLAAIGLDEGRIYIWSVKTPQRWSALAPDFVEVDENEEYVEQEDEFDIPPPEELHKRRLNLEDEKVDVLTHDEIKSSQFQPGDFIMPVILNMDISDSEDDVVAIGAGQFRRKTPGKEWMEGENDVTPSGDESRKAGGVNGRGAQNGSKRRKPE
jgi:COMPASS component SWD1